MALAKTLVDPTTPVRVGDDVTFAIEVTNQGTIPMVDVEVIDYIPAGYSYNTSNDANGWEYDGTNATIEIAGPLGFGESETLQIVLTVLPTAQADNMVNVAELTSFFFESGVEATDLDIDSEANDTNGDDAGGDVYGDSNDAVDGDGTGVAGDGVAETDEDDSDPAVPNVLDLALTKTIDPATPAVRPGDIVTFTIEVCNQGNIPVSSVVVEDRIPAGLILSPTDANGWTVVDATTLSNTLGMLGREECATIEIDMEVLPNSSPADMINVAEITEVYDTSAVPVEIGAFDIDSRPNDDNGEAAGTLGTADDDSTDGSVPAGGDSDDADPAAPPVMDLAIQKINPVVGPSDRGDVIPFEITVFNQGNMVAEAVEVTDYIPAGLQATGANAGWTIAGATATYTVPVLQPGADTTLVINLEILQSATPMNVVNMSEISSATDTLGVVYSAGGNDYDSDYDADNGNDVGNEIYDFNNDNVLDEYGIGHGADGVDDEDDHDQAWALLCDKESCIGDMNVSVDINCEVLITPDMVLTGDLFPNQVYEITITDHTGQVVSNPIGAEHIGKDLEVSVANTLCSNNSCWLTITVEDKYRPSIEVSNDTIFCNELVPATTPDTSFVRLIEGCSGARIELVDERMETIDCDSTFTGRVTRQYRAVGLNGMISPTVTQVIMIRRLQQSPITFPVNRMIATSNALHCDGGFALDNNGNPLPTVGSDVGVPMMAGRPLFPLADGIICSGYVEYRDRILTDSSACVKKIMRTWEVGEWWCGATTPRMGVQIIEIVDNEGPVLTAMPDITVSTGGHACSAMVDLPAVQATDNCTAPARYTVAYGQGDFLTTNGGRVEISDSTMVTYTVYDECENSSTTSFMVTVVDEADPIALCERWTNVPITIGETRVPAVSFDDGSFDECGPVTYQVARLTDGCGQTAGMFRDSVTFCCMDAGDTIMVQLRVTDLGGNQNTCTVFAIVDDKVPPIVTCPADTVVQCGFVFDETRMSDFFGNPTVVDNCGENVTFEDRLLGELTDCGLGVLTREIDVLSNGRVLRTCTQLITYSGGDVFDPSTIVWPLDTVITGVCDSATIDPANLLPGYNEPTFTIPACGQVGFGFEDAPFISADPADSMACIKVLRTWSIIDWCERDANGLYVVYDRTQVLKIMPDTSTSMRVAVAGMIVKEDGDAIGGVEVELVGAESKYDMTEVQGDYAFPDMPTGGTYEVLPSLDKDHDNGVSTLDLVLIQRHILGFADLVGPYQRIAADVNADNRVSGADVVELRRLVLGKISEFESNTSWRFIDGGYAFPDQQDPWLEVFPEDYFITQLMGDLTIDFVGLKVGDINGSADNLQGGNEQLDSRSGYVSIAIEDQYVVAGQVVEIPVLAGTSGTLYGWQYAIAADGIDVQTTIPGKAAMTPLYTHLVGDNLKVSYDDAQGLVVDAGDVLYTITAIAEQSGRLSDLLEIDDTALRAEMYSGDNLTVRNATIEWREPAYELDAFAVEQNKPNPWSDHTQIDFYIPTDGPVTVRVTDMTGRLLKTLSDIYRAGHHSVTLRKEDLGASGVLSYEVEYADKLEVRKMILLD